MYDGNQIFVLGVLGGTLASFAVLFVTFAFWICSLRDDLHVHAPLLDAPKRFRRARTPA